MKKFIRINKEHNSTEWIDKTSQKQNLINISEKHHILVLLWTCSEPSN